MADGSVKIIVNWDDSNVSKGIKQTQKEIESKLDDVQINAEVKATDKGIQELQEELEKIEDVTVNAKVEADTDSVGDLQQSLDKIDDVSINADINIDDSSVKQVNKLLDDLDTSVTPKINIDDSDIDQARKKIEDLEQPVNVPINADTSGLDLGGALGVGGAIVGITALAASTQEYNEDLAKLKTNTDLAGDSFENAEQQLKNLNAITGETDSNVEALSNLMQAGFTGDNLASVVEDLSGAVIKFPDTLKIEGLSDSIQETIATGEGIGTFTELLERMGVDLDNFNAQLQTGFDLDKLQADYNAFVDNLEEDVKAPSFDTWLSDLGQLTTESERVAIVQRELEKLDLSEVNDQYREQNEAIVANRDAQFELNSALAEIGTAITPLITSIMPTIANMLTSLTPIIVLFTSSLLPTIETIITLLSPFLIEIPNLLAPILQGFTQFLDVLIQNRDVVGLIAVVLGTIIGLYKTWQLVTTIVTAAQTLLNVALNANPIGLIILAIGALVAAFTYLWNTSDEFRNFWINLWNGIVSFFTAIVDGIVYFFTDTIPLAIEFLRNAFSGGLEFINNIFGAFFDNIKTYIESIVQIFSGLIDFFVGVFTGDWSRAWQGIQDIIGGIFNGMIAIVKAPINYIIGLINGMISAINLAIGGINNLNIDIPDWVPGIGGGTLGFNIPKIPSIPYLARGGIVNRATQAVIGEDGAEAVIPLEKNTQGIKMIADLISAQMGTGQEIVIHLNTYLDSNVVYKQIVKANSKNTQRTGKNALAT